MQKLTVSECTKRKVDDTYLIVYAIKNEVNIKKGEYIEKEILYTFIGIDKKGFRQLINIIPDRPNNKRYWLDYFESIKNKGVENILFLSVDDNKNMKRTAKIAFPNIVFVDSMTDIVPKFYKYTTEKDNKILSSKINKLYTQKTSTELKKELDIFKSVYNNVIHQKLIEKYLSNIENIYKYSENIRKLLFKYNANMAIYDRIRITFNQQKSYITDINEIYESLGDGNKYFGFTSFKKKEWTLILNDIIKLYTDIDFI